MFRATPIFFRFDRGTRGPQTGAAQARTDLTNGRCKFESSSVAELGPTEYENSISIMRLWESISFFICRLGGRFARDSRVTAT